MVCMCACMFLCMFICMYVYVLRLSIYVCGLSIYCMYVYDFQYIHTYIL